MDTPTTTRPSRARRLTPVAPWPMAGTVEEHVRAETVRAIFQQAIAAPILTLLVTLLVGAGLWRVTLHSRLLIWLGVIEEIAVLDTLLQRADEALYRAKRGGRNRVSD